MLNIRLVISVPFFSVPWMERFTFAVVSKGESYLNLMKEIGLWLKDVKWLMEDPIMPLLKFLWPVNSLQLEVGMVSVPWHKLNLFQFDQISGNLSQNSQKKDTHLPRVSLVNPLFMLLEEVVQSIMDHHCVQLKGSILLSLITCSNQLGNLFS